jgi:hypothetical protein
MKKGVRKQTGIVILLIALSLVLFFCVVLQCISIQNLKDGSSKEPSSSGGGGQGVNYAPCNTTNDCRPRTESFCLNNSAACNFTTYYNCSLNKCVPSGCHRVCFGCQYGCEAGNCLGNLSDLIISDINYFLVTETSQQIVVNITVKNIGTATAFTSITRVLLGSNTISSFQTPVIHPRQSVSFNLTYVHPIGTSYKFKAIADAEQTVNEQREDNNVREIEIRR